MKLIQKLWSKVPSKVRKVFWWTLVILFVAALGKGCWSCHQWSNEYEARSPSHQIRLKAHAMMDESVGKGGYLYVDSWGSEYLPGDIALARHPEWFGCRTDDVTAYTFRSESWGGAVFYRICCHSKPNSIEPDCILKR